MGVYASLRGMLRIFSLLALLVFPSCFTPGPIGPVEMTELRDGGVASSRRLVIQLPLASATGGWGMGAGVARPTSIRFIDLFRGAQVQQPAVWILADPLLTEPEIGLYLETARAGSVDESGEVIAVLEFYLRQNNRRDALASEVVRDQPQLGDQSSFSLWVQFRDNLSTSPRDRQAPRAPACVYGARNGQPDWLSGVCLNAVVLKIPISWSRTGGEDVNQEIRFDLGGFPGTWLRNGQVMRDNRGRML